MGLSYLGLITSDPILLFKLYNSLFGNPILFDFTFILLIQFMDDDWNGLGISICIWDLVWRLVYTQLLEPCF